ncbi:MAG: hypothetical protein AAFO07_22520 [Bacteroidota bacterium]
MKRCLDCGEVLIGRRDKKFCSSYCRTNFHNKQRPAETESVKRITKLLKQNRQILKHFLEKTGEQVAISDMVNSGFNFKYFTHIELNGAGQSVFYCYDFAYQINRNGNCLKIFCHN